MVVLIAPLGEVCAGRPLDGRERRRESRAARVGDGVRCCIVGPCGGEVARFARQIMQKFILRVLGNKDLLLDLLHGGFGGTELFRHRGSGAKGQVAVELIDGDAAFFSGGEGQAGIVGREFGHFEGARRLGDALIGEADGTC